MSSESDHQRLWNRNFLLSAAINFLMVFIFYLLVVIIGPFVTGVLKSSLSTGGLAVGISIVGTLLGRLLMGQLVDRIGRKRTLIAGTIVFALISPAYLWVESTSHLIILRLLHGLSLGVAGTATAAIMAHSIPAGRKAEGVGYFSLSTTLGTATGPFLGLLIMNSKGFQLIFMLCCVLALLAVVCAVLVLSTSKTKELKDAPPVQGFSWGRLVEARTVPIASIVFLASLCYAGVLAFVTSYASSLKLVSAASLFFVVYSAVILLSRPFTGRLIDKKGSNIVLIPCLLLFAAGLLVMALTHNSISLLLAAGLIGLGFGNVQSATQAIAVKLVSAERMSLATSTWFIFLDAGLGFGPYLLGLIVPLIGFRVLYGLLAALALLTIGIYWLLHGRHDKQLLPIHHP